MKSKLYNINVIVIYYVPKKEKMLTYYSTKYILLGKVAVREIRTAAF